MARHFSVARIRVHVKLHRSVSRLTIAFLEHKTIAATSAGARASAGAHAGIHDAREVMTAVTLWNLEDAVNKRNTAPVRYEASAPFKDRGLAHASSVCRTRLDTVHLFRGCGDGSRHSCIRCDREIERVSVECPGGTPSKRKLTEKGRGVVV